jgi:drug/metabolite transporter (DMT)-like permease
MMQQAYAFAFALLLVLVAAMTGAAVLPIGLTAGGVVSTIVSGLMYYGLANWLYLSGLRHVPASIAAVSFYLIPVFGVAAATLLGDRLGPVQWLGAIVVVLAVASITLRSAQSTQAMAAASPPGGLRPPTPRSHRSGRSPG